MTCLRASNTGRQVRFELELVLKGVRHRFQVSLRPVFDARKQVIGMVPAAVQRRT